MPSAPRLSRAARALAVLAVGAPVVGPTAAGAQPTAALERRPVLAPAARLRTGADSALVGELRVPDGRGPFPVAIVVHGGCWMTRFADDRYMRPLADAVVAEEGVATWTVRYRRADEPGGGWPGTFADLAAAADSVRALARRFPLDTTRVFVVGHSAGASLGAWLAARPRLDAAARGALPPAAPLRVRGVVAVDGPLDLIAARPMQQPVCSGLVVDRLLGGTPDAVPAAWRAASPGTWLADAPALPTARGRAAGAATRPAARPARDGIRQAMVIGGLDAMLAARIPAGSQRTWATRTGAAVFVADTTDHFSMLDPALPAWRATRGAVRAVLGRPMLPDAAADRAQLAEAYRAIVAGMHARSLDDPLARLAPDFTHHALDPQAPGGVRVTPRDRFVAGFATFPQAVDSLVAFTIDVTDVQVRGDSAEVRYREHLDAFWKPRAAGGTPMRDSSTSWWADRWVRTPAGWRAVRFVEVAPPAARAPRTGGRR